MRHTPLGVILVILALLTAAALANRYDDGTCADRRTNAEYNDSKRDAPLGGVSKRYQTDPKAYREEWRNEQDLNAQRDMAEWAKWMLVATCASVVATLIGIGFVAETLKISRQQLRESINTARNSDRAYVQASKAELVWVSPNPPRIIITVSNTGNTPALWYRYRCVAVPFSENVPVFDNERLSPSLGQQWFGVAPNASLTVNIQDDRVIGEVDKARKGDLPFRIDGDVCYETFFGEIFVSEFSFILRDVPRPQHGYYHAGEPEPEIEHHKFSRTAQPLRCFHLVKTSERT